MRSEPVESLFAPPESEPMTTTKTARDMRNAGRPFSNRADCLALEEVVPTYLITCAAFAVSTVRLIITTPTVNDRTMKCTFGVWSVHGYTGVRTIQAHQRIQAGNSNCLSVFGPLRTGFYVHTTLRCFAYPNSKYAILASPSKTTLQG